MRTSEYIDRCRKLTATGSDYAVAKLLGISENAVNSYRLGRRAMSVDVAAIVAEKLHLPLLEIIADVQLEHARDSTTKARWAKLRKTGGRQAAAVLLAIVAAAMPQHGDARTVDSTRNTGSESTQPSDGLTIMRHLQRLALRAWRAVLGLLTFHPTPKGYPAP